MGGPKVSGTPEAGVALQVLDAIPQLLWRMNDAGRVTYANRACLEYAGVAEPALPGLELAELIHPDDHARVRALWHDPQQDRGSLTLDLRLCRHDRVYRWMRVRIQPFRAEAAGTQYLCSAADVEGEYRSHALQQVTASLSGALTPAQVIQVVLEQAIGATGAYAGYVALLDGHELRIHGSHGYAEEDLSSWRRFALDLPLPITDAVREARARYLSVHQLREQYPHMTQQVRSATAALAALPLRIPERTMGGLALAFREARPFDAEEREFIEALAGLCAQALERARLYEVEARSRIDADAARERRTLLDEATLQFTATLNAGVSLGTLAELSVPRLARWCVVYLPDGQQLRPLTVVHGDPAGQALLEESLRRQPPRLDARHGPGLVYRTGRSEHHRPLPDDWLEALNAAPEDHARLRRLGLHAVLSVPIRVHHRSLGVLVLGRPQGEAPFSAEEQAFVEELARRAALALENARLYDDARRSEERYRSLVDATAQIVWTTPASGDFEGDQPGWSAFTGQATAQLLGRGWLEAIHPEDREATGHAWREALAARHTYEQRHRLRRADGTYRHMQVRAVPVVNADGSVREWVGLHADITGLVHAEEEVRQLNTTLEARVRQRTRELEDLNAELRTFTYSVSHDLQAPVRHILGFSGLLARHAAGQLDEKSSRYLQAIGEAAERMGRLIEDLLHLSRLGRQTLNWERVELRELVQSIRAQLAPDEHGRSIAWHLGELPSVRSDRGMLSVALTNLLGNAVKYTRPREQARVEVWSERRANELVVHVRDNGVGFEPKWQDRLFGAFQRLHHADEFEGNGVGLANVRRAIHRLGGRTWAQGTPGEGATFSFSLPLEPPEH